MAEQQRLTWLLSMPACAQVNQAMQKLTAVSFNSGEQNKDMFKSRQERDMKDTFTIHTFLKARNPFSLNNHSLKNIDNGVIAGATVNADTAKDVGQKILQSMIGQSTSTYSFKKKSQAVTLGMKSSVKIDDELVHVDPQLLFDRLTFASKPSDNFESLFKYELCSHQPSLFDSSQLLREANKSSLANAI